MIDGELSTMQVQNIVSGMIFEKMTFSCKCLLVVPLPRLRSLRCLGSSDQYAWLVTALAMNDARVKISGIVSARLRLSRPSILPNALINR